MKRQSKSSYARHNKRPFQYSALYHAWAKAVDEHGLLSEEADYADRMFRRHFGVKQLVAGQQRDFSMLEAA